MVFIGTLAMRIGIRLIIKRYCLWTPHMWVIMQLLHTCYGGVHIVAFWSSTDVQCQFRGSDFILELGEYFMRHSD